MNSAFQRVERREGWTGRPAAAGASRAGAVPRPIPPTCQRCGFAVPDRAWGCKNPCANCGTLYPLGDCSD